MQESNQIHSAADHTHANKKRKMVERVVVAVKIEGNDKKHHRNEWPPSDRWSWRKYGQKPIKGSPYPRGYYRCSTSKGCSAKKQVERCKTDASMLIITYTSTHNHPDPASSLPAKHTNSVPPLTESHPTSPTQEQQSESNENFETQSPLDNSSAREGNPFEQILQTPGVLASKALGRDHHHPSLLKSQENDFYDDLEELPTSSFFTAFMKRSFCDERIAVNLS